MERRYLLARKQRIDRSPQRIAQKDHLKRTPPAGTLRHAEQSAG